MMNSRKLGLVSLVATLGVACGNFEAEDVGAENERIGAASKLASALQRGREAGVAEASASLDSAADTGYSADGAAPGAAALIATPEMTFATINIGREYANQAAVQTVFERIRGVIGPKSGPAFIGWQEISEADPCGDDCEYDLIKRVFSTGAGWDNRRPDEVKVPVTSKGVGGAIDARAVFASPGEAGVSPTRKVTVVYYAAQNLSVINTHLIAGAWSCPDTFPALRKDYWQRGWSALKDEVKKELDKGRSAIVTGDLNRPRATSGCNPAWDPTSLHPRAMLIGGSNIDYIFAVPAAGQSFVYGRDGGSIKRGVITLGIDGHQGHWVRGAFR